MIIDKVTITGADDSTSLQDMIRVQEKYPFVEWGILLLEDRLGTPRYPSLGWLELLSVYATPEWKLAAHVCGRWTKGMLMGDMQVFNVVKMACFQRVQLNFRTQKTFWDYHFVPELPPNKQYIFQMGDIGNDVATYALQSSTDACILFDRSGGKGVSPEEWPAPIPNVYCGYAGGIGPDNIGLELAKLNQVVASDRHIWIDMETKVRSPDDKILDFDKVEAVLSAVANNR
jgi:hypothetical protein